MNNIDKINAYRKAEKRVKDEKTFYTHLTVYIIINIVIFIAIVSLRHYFYDGYLIWNLLSTPVIWGIFLLIHGVLAFRGEKKLKKISNKMDPLKKWEEQKITELINKEENIKDNTYE